MKPMWKDAPEWARFLAQDSNEDWYWHEECPRFAHGTWRNSGQMKLATPVFIVPELSLEVRPA